MLFNSFEFMLFLPLVYGVYSFMKTQKARLWLFLVASCFFYSFLIPKYLLILFLLIAVDFFAGIRIEESASARSKKFWLGFSLIANLGMLGFFKYTDFFLENINHIAQALHWNLSISALKLILPIGLSFHTFQSLSYVFEVYYGRFAAERSLLHYSVYVLYFPQLVAGPIERPQNILPQLHRFQSYDENNLVRGMKLLTQGLIKKSVVADTLAPLANQVFDSPGSFGTAGTLLGILAFTIQIYCDFSGYSDMARGISLFFGIDLMVNFKTPYFASSISEFWRRWHISLSTWFRDYLYIPLGGNRVGAFQNQLNLFAVFLLSGLWHGSNWTFIIWGALHGLYLMIENQVLRPLGFDRWSVWFRRPLVFVLVALGWVFFRANSVGMAFQTLHALSGSFWQGWNLIPAFRIHEALLVIVMTLMVESAGQRRSFWERVGEFPLFLRLGVYGFLLLLFLVAGQFAGNQFIYFQF